MAGPEVAVVANDVDSQTAAPKPSHKLALLDEAELLQRMFWSVPEAAFLLRASTRTVWRLMADPKSGFPKPKRVRGRTVLAREEVLAFMRNAS